MDVMEAIRTRRSIGKVKQDPVEREKIEAILEAGTWAPNHYHTEPWKFFVLTGEGRKVLGRTLIEISKEKMDDPTTPENQSILNKEENKPFRAPVVIAVAVTPSDQPRVIDAEEQAAVAAAIQNMLLAAHALGLGAIWRTGPAAYHPKMKEAFDLGERDQVLGFVYVGYPDPPVPVRQRTSYADKTVWIDEDRA